MCRAELVDTGSKEDIEQLSGWVKKGKAWAMGMLAQRYIQGVGVKQSDKKAIELYEMAAKRGITIAQANLGNYYRQGIHGVKQSSKRAIEYYTLAAEQGHTTAQINLGNAQYSLGYMYLSGDEHSYSKAREWMTKAAAQGSKEAINGLKQLDELGL